MKLPAGRLDINNLIDFTVASHILRGTNNSVSYRANARLGFIPVNIWMYSSVAQYFEAWIQQNR